MIRAASRNTAAACARHSAKKRKHVVLFGPGTRALIWLEFIY